MDLNGTTIAEHWLDLTDGVLENPIAVTALGVAVGASAPVWTGSNADGSSTGNSCSDWLGGPGVFTWVGSTGSTSAGWSKQTYVQCDPYPVSRLFCFEQWNCDRLEWRCCFQVR